jgi:mRNA interferase YafQ
MYKLILTDRFKKSFSKIVRKNPSAKAKIYNSIELLHNDINHPLLKTHKLYGKLKGLYAAKCGFDCRMIFSVEYSEIYNDGIILLIDIGKHDEVY